MSDEKHYSLQVVRIDNIPKKAKKRELIIEIALDKVVRKTGCLDDEGKPEWNDILTFSQSDIGSDPFAIRLKRSSALIGETTVDAEELPRGLTGKYLHRELHTEKRSIVGGSHSKKVGSIVLRLNPVDAETRAEIEIYAAVQRIQHIEVRDKVIGDLCGAAHEAIAIANGPVGIHAIFNVSWKAISSFYKLKHRQLQNDTELVEMVKEMKTVFDLCKEAIELNDNTRRLKPVVKNLLQGILECARFVREYSKHNSPRRMERIDSAKKIKEYLKELAKLKKDLHTAIRLNTSKRDIKLLQQLDALLLPIKSDPSAMLNRPRCLQGTRQGYLNLIMEFLSDSAPPNILWLTGVAGSGKSTIAVTASDLGGTDERLSMYMFFERKKSDPNSVIRTISYTLATLHPAIAQRVHEVLETNRTICGTTLKSQFEELLRKPLEAVAAEVSGAITIILDALDECGHAGDQGREELLHLLKEEFPKLPSKVRILITSRPEPDMKNFPATIKHAILEVDPAGVARYIREALDKDITDSDNDIEELCNAASGLFIWASTAIKMIRLPTNARENLQKLAKNIRSHRINSLDGLYATALEGSGIWSSPSRRHGTAIVALLLYAKERVTEDVVAGILGLDKRIVGLILSPLRSVISYEPGKPIRPHHASFADYLSRRSEGKPWHIDEAKEKRRITERCFDVMDSLRFNICNIESSFLYNSEIAGLEERIEENISPQLSYACRFWSAHLCELESPGSSDQVQEGLKKFVEDKLLYWLEVLSLTESFNRVAGRALREASSWVLSANAEISSLLWSAYNLVSVFALPISQSAPHIYLSAISLSKGESTIADLFPGIHPVFNVRTMGTRALPRCIKVLEGSEGVESLAVSTDGRLIASSSTDRMIRVWDTDNLEAPPSEFEVDEAGTIAMSPVGKYLVSCSRKGTVCTWEVGSGNRVSSVVTKIPGWRDALVAYSSDGERVVSVCNGRACIFDADDGKLQLVPGYFKDDADAWFHAVSTNGKYVAGTKGDVITIWDSDTGERIFKADIDVPGSITVSPDGKRVVAGSLILSIDSGDLVEASMKYVFCAAFSFNGKSIVSGNHFGETAILDADSGDVIWGPVKGHMNAVTAVTFTSDGKRVISGSLDGTVRIWDVTGGEFRSGSSDAHTGSVLSVAFSPDGKRVVSGSEDSTIRVWDSETGKLVSRPFEGHKCCVNSVAFSPNGKRIVSGSADKTIRIWDADSGKLALNPIEGHEDWVWSVAYSTDGKRIVSGSSDKTVCVWDASSGELVKGPFTGHTSIVRSVSFSRDGKSVVSGSSDETVCIWDVDTSELQCRLEGHSESVYSATFSPNGKHVASGSADNTIRIWDTGSGELVLQLLEAHTDEVNSVSYSPDGKCIVSGSNDQTVCVWDAESGQLVLGPLEGHTSSVESVSFSPDGKRVASGSLDMTIRVWDVSLDAIVPGLSEGRTVDAMAASPSSCHIGTAETSLEGSDVMKSRKARTFLDWRLHEDGWVKGERCELLVWIPEDRRATLWRPRNTAVFSCKFLTRLDFSSSPIGEDWTTGFPLPSQERRLPPTHKKGRADELGGSAMEQQSQYLLESNTKESAWEKEGVSEAEGYSLPQIPSYLENLDVTNLVVDKQDKMVNNGGYCDIFVGQMSSEHLRCRMIHGGARTTVVKVAIKRLRLRITQEEAGLLELLREATIWAGLDHPNILPFIGLMFEGVYLSFVSEWMALGSLRDFLRKDYTKCDIPQLALGIAEGLKYLHDRNIVHSDIKPDNVLVSGSLQPLICDFGISRVIDSSQTLLRLSKQTDPKGSVPWMARELLQYGGVHSKESDIWAFGMTLYEMVSRQVPFAGSRGYAQIILAVSKGDLPKLPTSPTGDMKMSFAVFSKLCSMCENCWAENPGDRPTMATMIRVLSLLSDNPLAGA